VLTFARGNGDVSPRSAADSVARAGGGRGDLFLHGDTLRFSTSLRSDGDSPICGLVVSSGNRYDAGMNMDSD